MLFLKKDVDLGLTIFGRLEQILIFEFVLNLGKIGNYYFTQGLFFELIMACFVRQHLPRIVRGAFPEYTKTVLSCRFSP